MVVTRVERGEVSSNTYSKCGHPDFSYQGWIQSKTSGGGLYRPFHVRSFSTLLFAMEDIVICEGAWST